MVQLSTGLTSCFGLEFAPEMDYPITMSDDTPPSMTDPFAPPTEKGVLRPKTNAAPQFDHSAALHVFVWGVLSMVVCQLAGPVAWILGARYKERCELEGVRPDGLGVAGYILGISATVLMGISVLLALLILASVN